MWWGGRGGRVEGAKRGGGGCSPISHRGSPEDELHKHWMLTAEMRQVKGGHLDTEDEVTG